MKKYFVYCKNCKHLNSFERFYCAMVNKTGGHDRAFLNEYNSCEFYEKAKWRFWV